MGNETTVVELRALANLINDSVEKIEAACKAGPKSYPLLDDSFTPDSEAIRKDPTVAAEGDIIVAAATQLIAAVRPPSVSLTVHALQVSMFPTRFRRVSKSPLVPSLNLSLCCGTVACCRGASRRGPPGELILMFSCQFVLNAFTRAYM